MAFTHCSLNIFKQSYVLFVCLMLSCKGLPYDFRKAHNLNIINIGFGKFFGNPCSFWFLLSNIRLSLGHGGAKLLVCELKIFKTKERLTYKSTGNEQNNSLIKVCLLLRLKILRCLKKRQSDGGGAKNATLVDYDFVYLFPAFFRFIWNMWNTPAWNKAGYRSRNIDSRSRKSGTPPRYASSFVL